MKYLVTENMIMWAFRYALGRRTGAVIDVVEQLKKHWEGLEPNTRIQIQEEILIAIDRDRAGDDCDVQSWNEIIEFDRKSSCPILKGKNLCKKH